MLSTSPARLALLPLLVAAGALLMYPRYVLAYSAEPSVEDGRPDSRDAPALHLVDPGQLRYDGEPAKPADLRLPGGPAPPAARPALTAAVESLTVFLLWANYNRLSGTKEWSKVTPESVRTNLSTRWVLDDNEYYVNQMGHPYQGSLSFGAARSAGLGFWASTAYPFAFSALWELAGETERPALNDQVTTTVGANVLGEILSALRTVSAPTAESSRGRRWPRALPGAPSTGPWWCARARAARPPWLSAAEALTTTLFDPIAAAWHRPLT